MRFVIDTYRLLVGRSRSSEEVNDDFDKKFARKAASRFSRGNVAIQFNSFVTTNDLENERNEVAKLSFHN